MTKRTLASNASRDFGAIPTISYGLPLIRMLCPRMAGSFWKRDSQKE